MNDYISREMTIDAICRLCNANFEEDPCEQSECEMMSLLRKIPAAAVRPVVMCCDCKHFQVNISPSGYLPQGVPEWECRYWLRPTDPTDFCSYGEKWEES